MGKIKNLKKGIKKIIKRLSKTNENKLSETLSRQSLTEDSHMNEPFIDTSPLETYEKPEIPKILKDRLHFCKLIIMDVQANVSTSYKAPSRLGPLFGPGSPLQQPIIQKINTILVDIGTYVQANLDKIQLPEIIYIFEICEEILSRTLTTPSSAVSEKGTYINPILDEGEEIVSEPLWSVYYQMYNLMLIVIYSKCLNNEAILQVMDYDRLTCFISLFYSYDKRERKSLKTFVQCLYINFPSIRLILREELVDLIQRFIYTSDNSFKGIEELLEIFSSIMDTVSIPIKAEFNYLLKEVLLPLHMIPKLSRFYRPLIGCLRKFMLLDEQSGIVIFEGLLKYWPVSSSMKELIFIKELEEFLDVWKYGDSLPLEKIMKQIIRCAKSPNFQIAENALILLSRADVTQLVLKNKTVTVMSIVINGLKKLKESWHTTIAIGAEQILRAFKSYDVELFEKVENYKFEHLSEKGKKKEELIELYMKLRPGN
eukprot:GAHX01001662.1.p1 GENE.GAHX01001662.1~~GAHX01001662.1.p1  ORF type:complete len:484 (-),score=74.58 GAHX01001662.1:90-1541(-)